MPTLVPTSTLPSFTNFPGLTSSTFPPLSTFAPFNPSSTGLSCYVCNERNQACVAPINPTRISVEKCSGYCVKYQNANDGNSKFNNNKYILKLRSIYKLLLFQFGIVCAVQHQVLQVNNKLEYGSDTVKVLFIFLNKI